MAIGNKKSKMGSLLGVDLNSMNQKAEEAVEVKPEKIEVSKPESKRPVQHVSREIPGSSVGGRPKFELISGMQEKKVNFHCPEELYTAINLEAIKQKKTIKQFICEVLLDEMSSKYGFKLK